MLDWDDYRFFLALARAGTLTGAGASLGVNHATVLRRVGGLEKRLGVRLFDKGPGGHTATPAGDRIRAAAERMEEEHLNLERHVLGEDLRLEGNIRVASTSDLLEHLLAGILVDFQARYPGIRLEIVTGQQQLSLVRRETDMALRPTRQPPDNAVGRRLATLASALYAAPDYLEQHGADWRDPSHRWIAPDESLARYPAWGWLRSCVARPGVTLQANTMSGMRSACRSGAGIAPLPCFMADGDARLVRLTGPIDEMASDLWLLTHADLRHTARIRAFMDFAADVVIMQRSAIEGTQSSPNPELITETAS